MASRSGKMSAAKFDKWIAEGRGAGHGAKYSPWLRVQDVPSRGNVNRIRGWKSGRTHHLMSNLEANYFYILDWSEKVTDIREQYPLLPLDTTEAIAERLHYKHPRIPTTSDLCVMTSDFIVTIHEGETEKIVARAIKPASELTNDRVIQKLEIERQFWNGQGVDWGLVTENEIDSVLANNIKLIHSHASLSENFLSPSLREGAGELLFELIGEDRSLADAAMACDRRLGLNAGSSLTLALHFIATRRWRIDMSKPIDPSRRLIVVGRTIQEDHGNLRQHAA